MRDLSPGDYLIFQLEAGYGVLRLLAVDVSEGSHIWHLAAYDDFFLDVDMAEAAASAGRLKVSHPHLALTERAFESTQTAKLFNQPLTEAELSALRSWREQGGEVSDRSVRLLLGLR